jgi:hypothetical protein
MQDVCRLLLTYADQKSLLQLQELNPHNLKCHEKYLNNQNPHNPLFDEGAKIMALACVPGVPVTVARIQT